MLQLSNRVARRNYGKPISCFKFTQHAKRLTVTSIVLVGVSSCGGFSPTYKEGPDAPPNPNAIDSDSCLTEKAQSTDIPGTENIASVSLADVQKILDKKCVSCHSGTTKPLLKNL